MKKFLLFITIIFAFNSAIAQNLLINGSAEITPIDGNGWTIVSPGFSSIASSNAQDGARFFYANQTALANITQEVDVSGDAIAIDAQEKTYRFSVYFRSFNQANPDESRAVVEYLDNTNNVLATYDTGFFASVNDWIQFENYTVAPIGTRSIKISLLAMRNASSGSNDGYIDNVVLEDVSLVSIPDSNFEQAILDNGLDSDGTVNGVVFRSDIINISNLDVSGKNISDLTGIEGFFGIETLNVSNNNLATVNFSRNELLSNLTADSNQLSGIDLSFNLALESLSLSDNSLTLMDLSLNTNITSLFLNNNQLSNLDISSLSLLEELSVSNNFITDLTVALNTNLSSLDASSNSLEQLNIRNGNNTNIPTDNFNTINNPNLNCITVDAVPYSIANWSNVDNQTSFAIDCLATNPNNLLHNGSAEIAPVIGNGWFEVSPGFRSATSSNAQDGNQVFFAGASSISEIFQEIDVSENATAIDAGIKTYRFSTYFLSFNQANPDEARALVEYIDDSDNVLSSYDTGFIASVTDWQKFENYTIAPIGTRSIKISLFSRRNASSGNNDGYIDDVVLEDVSIVAIPDSNFEQALIDATIDTDGIINGEVLRSDVINVDVLDISSKNISDLTGIEAFFGVETLNASNNNLETIDISSNQELSGLLLGLNQLSAIDTSVNPNLISIVLSENNLMAVDLSSNVSLTQVFIDDNQLSSIDVSNLELLEQFSVSANSITDLSFSFNPNLEIINISDNDLVSVNLKNGNNTAIIDANFNASDNPNLVCITVDNVQYSSSTWTNIDNQTSFAFDCAATNQNNLVFNGSAEIIPVIGNGWTQVEGNTTALLDSDNTVDGLNYFYGNQSPNTEFYQDVDLNVFANEIDTGNKSFTFTFHVQSFNQANADDARAVVEYRDASNNVLDIYDSGYLESLDVWLEVEDIRLAPIGTRSVRISMFQQRTAGNSNDGYIDDIVFQESPAVEIPDANFEQALIDFGIDTDGLINQQVFQNDISDILILDVSGLSISDLTGIEGFLSLQILDASNNDFNTVDLSQNSPLLVADLNDNQLSSIDLSGNPNLGILRVANNMISDLDLTTNPLLIELDLDGNQLSQLDLTNLTLLENLSLTNNSVVELDLSQNTALNQLDASNNNLANLNMQNDNNSVMDTDSFNVLNNANLFCIRVDDITYSNSTWTNIDSQSSFGSDCEPSNDGCVEAQSLDLGILVSGTTQSATSSGINPSCQENGIILIDVWYEFVAPTSGSIAILATSALNQVKVAVYENCSDTVPIACDNAGVVVDNLTVGATYYIQTWVEIDPNSRSLNTTVGDFTIQVQDGSTLSLLDLDLDKDFKLFPNPANTEVTIKSKSIIDNVSLFDISGKQVLTKRDINLESYKIDLKSISKGLYLLQIQSQNSIINKKLIIK